MKRFAFLTIIVISSVTSLLSQAERKIFVDFSLQTVNIVISTNLCAESALTMNGIHLSVANQFAAHGVFAAVSADQPENHTDSFVTSTRDIRFSVSYKFCGCPQVQLQLGVQ